MGILVEAPVDLQGVDRELNYNETTHYDNNSYATSDSHTTSVIQGDTDGGTGGSVAPTPSARAPFKRPAPAPKDSKTSESSPKDQERQEIRQTSSQRLLSRNHLQRLLLRQTQDSVRIQQLALIPPQHQSLSQPPISPSRSTLTQDPV